METNTLCLGYQQLRSEKEKIEESQDFSKTTHGSSEVHLILISFPHNKKNTLEMFVGHCNLCRVPTKKASLLNGKGSVSKVNTWESMPLASKTFRKIYLPTMMINNC